MTKARIIGFALLLSGGALMTHRAPQEKGRLPYAQEQARRTLAAGKTPVILYHGGPVMAASTNLYIVYYGSFTATQHNILDTFLQNIGGSPAFNVNTEYYDSANQHVQNVLNYSPATDSYNDAYSQ